MTPIPDLNTRFARPIVLKTGEHVSAETLYNRCCEALGYVVRDHIGDLVLDNLSYGTPMGEVETSEMCAAIYAWADRVRVTLAAGEPGSDTSYLILHERPGCGARSDASAYLRAHWGDADPRTEPDPIVSQDRLFIVDDYGSETYIKTIYADTLLGIRRAVRELNPGAIPIYSDYDCTGLVCGQSCKMLKIYRTHGGYTVVVEITVTRDV